MLPSRRPRVLLIDEMDKASFDLPSDLLSILEEGRFTIPELKRLEEEQAVIPADAHDANDRVVVRRGDVAAHHHPVVVITSNGERAFPEAFRRRCVPLDLHAPSKEMLRRVVRKQLGGDVPSAVVDQAIEVFRDPATDQILQVVFLQDTFNVPLEQAAAALRRED